LGKLLWTPSAERVKSSNMHRFMEHVNKTLGKNFEDYAGLYQWSVENIADFWACFWDWAGIVHSADYRQVVDDPNKMPGAKWFSGAKLNFAQNLLRFKDERTAIVFKGEGREPVYYSYARLYDAVARMAKALADEGIKAGDRVVGFMPNMPQTIIAMLAASSLGATWSSCSPDFGVKGVLDRFGQIKPTVLFTADGYLFKGKAFDSLEKIRGIVQDMPSLKKLVVVPYISEKPDIAALPNAVLWDDFTSHENGLSIDFVELNFDHPLYIMYSSGTTGLPKCMVQSAGGILVHHAKEHILHTNLTRDDTLFYFTTCGWMMWNWLTSALFTGCTIVLYDGNPFHPTPGVLWELAQDERFTVFGTSAGYIGALMATDYIPKDAADLSSLKTLLSTGSPLSEDAFEWVYKSVKADMQLASIAGGTDLNGCFALGNPMGPVYTSELQCRGLAMAVEAWDENAKPVVGQKGELVCTKAFPSMPLYFWDDPEGAKYHDAYFDTYPGVWRHGDFIEVTPRGGVIMYGRSDATLNPGGVRIGTAEIYRVVDKFEEVADSVVVGQDFNDDIRVILFVKMAENAALTDELKNRLKKAIRENASPRHVPALIIEVPDIPYTLNMKKVEIAVKKVIEGKPVKNKDALLNPQALDHYANIPELAK
jgi:acetoacetyl-CoA synthetase